MSKYKDLGVEGWADFTTGTDRYEGWNELQNDFQREYPSEDKDNLVGLQINHDTNSFMNSWIVNNNGEETYLPTSERFQDYFNITIAIKQK